MILYILQTPPQIAGCNRKSFLKQSTSGLNSKFFFSLTGYQTKAKELSLPNILPIAEEKKDGLMLFSRELM